MMKIFSVSCWILLHGVAAGMLIPMSFGPGGIAISCCNSARRLPKIEPIKTCFEQTKEMGCKVHAYRIESTGKSRFCVKPNTPWLRRYIKANGNYPPVIKPSKHRFYMRDNRNME